MLHFVDSIYLTFFITFVQFLLLDDVDMVDPQFSFLLFPSITVVLSLPLPAESGRLKSTFCRLF